MVSNNERYSWAYIPTLKGETDAFGDFVHRHQDAVYANTLYHTASFADVEDIAQEAFIEVYRNLHKLRDPAKFPSWPIVT